MTSIPSWAKPGVKVVCVDDREQASWGLEVVVLGQTYTIDRVADIDERGSAGLILREVKTGQEWLNLGYRISRFRPLVSTKTEAEDVALFQDIARKANMVTEEVNG